MGYEFFDIITIVISGILLLLNIRKVQNSSLYIIYIFFFFIYVLPLFLDYILGQPSYFYKFDAANSSYNRYRGFILSYCDTTTRILYDIFILSTQILLLFFQRKEKSNRHIKQDGKQFVLRKSTHGILVFFAFLPVVLSLLVGYYYIPFIFGWRENPVLSIISYGGYYSFIERFSYVGLTASMICLVMPKTTLPMKILMLALCYMNISIESKRSMVFFAFIVYLLLKSSGLGIKLSAKQIGTLVVLGACFVVYSSYIIKVGRGYSDEDILYTQIRIDLFRDDTARFIIYSFINGNRQVLDYPIQSYLSQIAFIFPLDIINGVLGLGIPSIGFNNFLTSALIDTPLKFGDKWMTTSMVDEVIANFAFLSVIIVPWILRIIAKLIDKGSAILQVLWLSALILSFMYSFNYIVYYIEFLLLFNYILNKQKA